MTILFINLLIDKLIILKRDSSVDTTIWLLATFFRIILTMETLYGTQMPNSYVMGVAFNALHISVKEEKSETYFIVGYD